jgi:hypothetical protein
LAGSDEGVDMKEKTVKCSPGKHMGLEQGNKY